MTEPNETISLTDKKGETRSLADIEAEVIASAVKRCAGNMSEVARVLGIGRSTLYRRIGE